MLSGKSHLRECLTRCRHCRIFFLTHPRNAGRADLGCPFGCREAHRKQSATERTREYYRSEAGRVKKRIQNEKRGVVGAPDPGCLFRDEPTGDSGNEPPPAGGCRDTDCEREAHPDSSVPERYTPSMVAYLVVVISLIEGRRVERKEILEMLRRALRQRSMVRQRRVEHSAAWLNEIPP